MVYGIVIFKNNYKKSYRLEYISKFINNNETIEMINEKTKDGIFIYEPNENIIIEGNEIKKIIFY